jgi:ABC transporter with metal-binding/Fe-S-binding domain ATP-binding protein
MKCAVLFSGGKDSVYSAYLAKKNGHEISCLISIFSENKESYMFHTPSITRVKEQAKVMDIPLVIFKTKGKKEEELKDLEKAIKESVRNYGIDCVVTGAIKSVYQSSRIQKICDALKIKCFNPLWQVNEIEYLRNLIENKFKIIIIGVFAYPLSKEWLGREINEEFIKEVEELEKKYKIHPAGEGGEFETFVLGCPLFKKELILKERKIFGEKNSWKMEIKLKVK